MGDRTIWRRFFLVGLILLSSLSFAHRTFPATRVSVASEDQWAWNAGLRAYRTDSSVATAIRQGELVPVTGVFLQGPLPRSRRFLRPAAADFIAGLNQKFMLESGSSLIVDSAVRSAQTQHRILFWNRSAAPSHGKRISSHEFGTTFDLSKKVIDRGRWRKMHRAEYAWVVTQLKMYSGQNRIHVIEERACLHVMVREDGEAGVQGSYASVDESSILERAQEQRRTHRHSLLVERELHVLSGQRFTLECDDAAGTCGILREQDGGGSIE